jgi:predicted peptidase
MLPLQQHFETQITQSVQLDYLLYLPTGYEDDPGKHWPLILYLHGAGAQGNDLELIKANGIPYNLENGHALPFIVACPQCPKNSHWTLHIEALNALLSEVAARYRVDESRIYLTGISLGGAGSWMLAGAHPERFAAVAPVAGRIVPLPLQRFKNLPVWAFHGEEDDAIPVSEAQRTIDALTAMGCNVQLTVFPGVGHDCWRQTYDNPTLYDWFLKHNRS